MGREDPGGAKGTGMSDIREPALRNAGRRHGNMTRATGANSREEVGATLVLALGFLLLGTIIIGALMSALTNDLNNSVHFLSARSEQYAARSATDLAINSIRYAHCSPSAPGCNTNTMLPQSLNASPPTWCWGSGPTSKITVDGVSVDVWCSTAWDPTSTNSRVVTFSACLDGIGAAQCAAQPYLQAVVTFDDYPAGVSAPSSAPCYLYCGTGMTTDSWLWSPVLPTVTNISPSSGSILGGTSVTISGTGFTTGTTVNFVEESGGSPAVDNTIVQATKGVVVNSSTSITALTPPVTEGTTYYVTVTTPTGTSAYNTNAVFTYSPVAPTVTSISPAIGTIAGGNAVTITGTGFYQSATQPITVSFIQESGSTVPSNPLTYTVTSPNVVVNGGTSITVVSPPVAGGSSCQTEFCYFVTVTTPAGTSATGAGSIFEYTEIPPLCASVSPVSGSAGTAVTISGAGFLTGSGTSADFVPEISGTPTGSGAGTPATITSITPDQITVTAPTAPTGTSTSFVTVTTVNGTCQDIPYFTY